MDWGSQGVGEWLESCRSEQQRGVPRSGHLESRAGGAAAGSGRLGTSMEVLSGEEIKRRAGELIGRAEKLLSLMSTCARKGGHDPEQP